MVDSALSVVGEGRADVQALVQEFAKSIILAKNDAIKEEAMAVAGIL